MQIFNRRQTTISGGFASFGMALLLMLLVLQPAFGQVSDTYENSGVYSGPGAPIVATNFVNDSGALFNISFPTLVGNTLSTELFDGWSSVQNYTNNGTMNCNTGFRFDTQTSGHIGALNFDNAGIINCGLGSDALPLFQYYVYSQSLFYVYGGIFGFGPNIAFFGGHGFGSIYSYGGINVLATNLVNSGSILSGFSSFMNFQGDSVDLTGGTMAMTTNIFSTFFGVGEPAFGLFQGFGLNTNFWSPSDELTPNFAVASAPFGLTIVNSTPYINIVNNYLGTNTLIQAVFILNEQSNSTPSVAFSNDRFGNDSAFIQWAGSYFDPSSGLESSNYLLLSDSYTLALSTNVLTTLNQVPDNFVFQSQPNLPFFVAGAVSGFPVGFAFLPSGTVTNQYSFVDAELQATTVGTNLVPGGALTNIAGRIQINASGTLNISGASISGLNYLSLRSTNQLVNDGLARIYSPYTDLYLGSTNGNLVMTNVLVSSVPNWNGTVSAWSSGWQTASPQGGTNYYEVLVVDSSLNPRFAAQQQDVLLFASNNLVVSDGLNIMRNFYTTATNLLLTTNAFGQGSLAVDGELNMQYFTFSWAAATPNLSILTNYGVITTPNITTFGSAAVPYLSLFNAGTISNANGTKIYANNFENSGLLTSGAGLLNLQAGTAILTNGTMTAGAAMSLSADTLIISNQTLSIGQGLTLAGTTLLTDTGPTNGNNWTIGNSYTGFGSVPGFSMLSKPLTGDLLGTTILAESPGAVLNNTWAGIDYGLSNAGYTNNEAIGRLILDGTTNGGHFGKFTFKGTSVSNAVYIDYLEFRDASTNGVNNNYEFTPWLSINTNITVYFAQAVALGVSIAEKIDNASISGKNGGRLRWIPSYVGHFSSTNLLNPDGTTNTVNAALAESNLIDSNGNGIVNRNDPTPFYMVEDVDLNVQVTNLPPLSALISWHSIPGSTNAVYYRGSLADTNWLVLTNFVSPSTVPPVGGWPITNLVTDPINAAQPHYYKVGVTPNNQLLYGR